MPQSLSDQIADACREVLSAEDCAEIRQLDPDAAFSYAFVALIDAGVDDPAEFLRERGIID